MTRETKRVLRVALFAIFPALLLAACGSNDEDLVEPGDGDAMEASALGDQILVDPDLAGENMANSAMVANLRDGILPPDRRSPEALAKARADAIALLGGPGSLRKAPQAANAANSGAGQALTAVGKAAASPGGKGDCASIATFTAEWAALLPANFPVYPLGAVADSAGTDDQGCSLRVVTFLTAVPLGEVLDFYYTRAVRASFTAEHALDGDYNVLGGSKGQASFIVFGRTLPTSATEITLVTSGN